MKLKILLISSPQIESISATYPLGLCYIAAVLKERNYDVEIFDYSKRPYSAKLFLQEVKKSNPDFIGFTVYSCFYNAIKEMIRILRNEFDMAKIIIGGPHVSALPAYSLEDMHADFAVVGEAELVMPEIIRRAGERCASFDDIKGLAYWSGNSLKFNPGCNLVLDLDRLPFPDRDILPINSYNETIGHIFIAKTPVAPILTSRGCPHHCIFCSTHVIHGRVFRRRSASNVVDEIEYLIRKYNVKEINFYDDTFSESPEHAIDICKEMTIRKLNISWRTAVGLRLSTINEELLGYFKASGCYQLSFGIESFSERLLSQIRKPISKFQIKEKIELIRRCGIETLGFFILGLPTDTEQSIWETINFARNSGLDFIIFTPLIPFPGSAIFEDIYNSKNKQLINWDHFNFNYGFKFELSKIPAAKLRKIYIFSYLYCHFAPKRIIKIMMNILFLRKINFLKIIKSFYYIIIKNLCN